jgi:ComF family protein
VSVRFERVLDVLFPSACAGCNRSDGPLCSECLPNGLARIRVGALDVFVLGRYEGRLRRATLAFKHGRRDVGLALAAALAKRFSAPPGVTLVPVPTTSVRRRERGFDQGVFLARELGRRCGIGVLEALRQTAGDAQRGRSRSARLDARGRFGCACPLIDGARVLLVDDVVTTGATLRDCAAVLSEAGARVAGAMVVAYAPEPGRGDP